MQAERQSLDTQKNFGITTTTRDRAAIQSKSSSRPVIGKLRDLRFVTANCLKLLVSYGGDVFDVIVRGEWRPNLVGDQTHSRCVRAKREPNYRQRSLMIRMPFARM